MRRDLGLWHKVRHKFSLPPEFARRVDILTSDLENLNPKPQVHRATRHFRSGCGAAPSRIVRAALARRVSETGTRNPHHPCPSNATSPGPWDQQQSADVPVCSLSTASTRSLIASVGVYDPVRTSSLSPSVSSVVLPLMTARLIVRPRKQIWAR